jgi:ankyrin repeat protein
MTIHDAVKAGRYEVVAAYISDGGDVEVHDALKQTLLHIAAAHGQTAIAKLLLAHRSNPNARNYRAFTPLHLAAGIGAADIVAALLDAGADARAESVFKDTPLHAIAAGGGVATADSRVAIVHRLLEAGASLEALDSTDRSPLWYAAATGTVAPPRAVMKARLAVVAALLAKGADPTSKARGEQGSPVEAARGLHQRKKYRIVWPEAVDLLEKAAAARPPNPQVSEP